MKQNLALSWLTLILVLVAGCPSSDSQETSSANAEAFLALVKDVPVYPNFKPDWEGAWHPPKQIKPGQWATTFGGFTPDAPDKVMDFYEKQLSPKGWERTSSPTGLITYRNQAAPGKRITLLAGPAASGQTHLRLIVQDE